MFGYKMSPKVSSVRGVVLLLALFQEAMKLQEWASLEEVMSAGRVSGPLCPWDRPSLMAAMR